MSQFTLYNDDCLAILRDMPSESVDSVVTDPPYGISFMGKGWDYDVPAVDIWRECLRVLKPGGHLLAFAGTRTQHRMAVAIEDAGFEIRDMIAWVYGSGFPKSLDVSKAIDRAAGAEREVVGSYAVTREFKGGHLVGDASKVTTVDITAPATPEAQQWSGWGTALKPSWECITMARKPLAGTVAENVLRWGTGGLNVDGCRIASDSPPKGYPNGPGGKSHHYSSDKRSETVRPDTWEPSTAGRWPSNLIHDGSDEVVGLFPSADGSHPQRPTHSVKATFGGGRYDNSSCYADSGSAARFFYVAKASRADRNEGLTGLEITINSAKLSDGRQWGKEARLARLLVDTEPSRPRVTAAFGALSNDANAWNTLLFGSGQTGQSRPAMTCTTGTATSSTIESRILSCFLGLLTSESTEAVNFGLMAGGSRVENVERGTQQITITSAETASALGAEGAALKTRLSISVAARANGHETVKPTDLMRYLCRLVTPPGGVVLDPFMGSGSTGKAAMLEGFRFIGIERESSYFEIAEARIEEAANRPKQTLIF